MQGATKCAVKGAHVVAGDKLCRGDKMCRNKGCVNITELGTNQILPVEASSYVNMLTTEIFIWTHTSLYLL